MNITGIRTSQSSYGDSPYLPSTSFGTPPPPAKILLDGYQDALNPENGEHARYNPLNPAHPRSSALLNANDPVAMYLLTETAMGDSMNYEILSFEEVEGLKKEYTFISGRVEATKRKLALEVKLRDAARSLSRLYRPKSSRDSEEYDPAGSPKSHRSRRSIFGRNGITETQDKTDEELTLSTRKCEELAQELWKLERRAQEVYRRLLEHTAGILQMTHKGLKKNVKNGMPRTPESVYSSNTHGSVYDFDDRSLYKTSEYLDEFGGNGKRMLDNSNGSGSMAVGLDAIQNTERRLEELSGRMRGMILQANPDDDFGPVPQPASSGGPVNPTTTVEAHLAYIERGLGVLQSHPTGASRAPESTYGAEEQLVDINARLHSVLAQAGLPRSPTIPPPPENSGGDLQEQLSYLNAGVNNLQSRIDGLLEQKSILTTQIQQQRELNSKSDAERDAHIADLVEQLAHVRKDLEISEHEGQATREELTMVMEQLDAVRQDMARQDQSRSTDDPEALAYEKEAHAKAKDEISRLEAAIAQLQGEINAQAEVHEARVRAEGEVSRLQSLLEQLSTEKGSHAEELAAARSHSENEIARLQSVIEKLHSEADARAEEATEARDRAEKEVSQLEAAMEQIRSDAEARVQEATALRTQAQSEVSRLEAAMEEIRNDAESQVKEATEARTQAEENAARLQAELTELEGDIVRAQTELTVVKAELDGAYGTRAQRAAEVAANPAIQYEIDALNTRNIELTEELAALKSRNPGSSELQQRVEMLEKELRETIDDYEAMTKASIEFEKERERFEGVIDSLRDRCEHLETQLSEERITWMGITSPTSVGRDGASETTSTMVLKNEFKKMMRDTRAENMKIIKAEQEERRRLEALVRNLKREQANKSSLGQSITAL